MAASDCDVINSSSSKLPERLALLASFAIRRRWHLHVRARVRASDALQLRGYGWGHENAGRACKVIVRAETMGVESVDVTCDMIL